MIPSSTTASDHAPTVYPEQDGKSPASAVSQLSMSGHSDTSSRTSVSQASAHTSAASSTTATGMSPNKTARSKAPTLDDIAARLKKTTVAENSEDRAENKALTNNETRSSRLHFPGRLNSAANGSAENFDSQPGIPLAVVHGEVPSSIRGRNEGLASLRDKAASRSRSISPVKAAHPIASMQPGGNDPFINGVESAAAISKSGSAMTAAAKEMPSLQDIIDRMSKKGISNSNSPELPSDTPKASEKTIVEETKANEYQITPKPTQETTSPVIEQTKPKSSTSEKTVIDKGHPLQHKWTMYFDSKSWNPSTKEISTAETPSSPSMSHSNSSNANSWEAALKMLGVYTTVENFMSIFSTLRRPSQLERNSNYHLFKDGIKPMWEDAANQNGGKWIITLRGSNPALLDRSWMWLVLALIGEELDDKDDVTGAVVSTRSKGDRIALWIRNKTDVDLVNKIGRKFVLLLDLEKEPGVSLEFSANSLEDGNSRKFAPSKFISFNNPPVYGSPSFGHSPLPGSHQQQLQGSSRFQSSSPSKGSLGGGNNNSRLGLTRQYSNDSPFTMGSGASIGRTASPSKGLGSNGGGIGDLLSKSRIGNGTSPPRGE